MFERGITVFGSTFSRRFRHKYRYKEQERKQQEKEAAAKSGASCERATYTTEAEASNEGQHDAEPEREIRVGASEVAVEGGEADEREDIQDADEDNEVEDDKVIGGDGDEEHLNVASGSGTWRRTFRGLKARRLSRVLIGS